MCLSYLLTTLCCPTALEKTAVLSERIELSVEGAFAAFLLVWWGIGAGVVTFMGPHNLAGNGYFACLVALAASLRLVNAAFYNAPAEYLRTRSGQNGGASAASKKYGTYLFASALVLLLSAMQVVFEAIQMPASGQGTSDAIGADAQAQVAAILGDAPTPPGRSYAISGATGAGIWSLMVAFITLRDTAVLAFMTSQDASRKITASLLVLLWLLTTIATTIEGPFRAAGNGYFAVWFGLASAALLALEELEKTLAADVHFVSAAVYTTAGVVLGFDSAPFLLNAADYYYLEANPNFPTVMPAPPPLPPSAPTSATNATNSTADNFGLRRLSALPTLMMRTGPDLPGASSGFPCNDGIASVTDLPNSIAPQHYCTKFDSNWAFAYGVVSAALGALLLLLLAVKANAVPSIARPVDKFLASLADFIEFEMRMYKINITGLQIYGAFCLSLAVAAGITLTYYFPPFSNIDDHADGCTRCPLPSARGIACLPPRRSQAARGALCVPQIWRAGSLWPPPPCSYVRRRRRRRQPHPAPPQLRWCRRFQATMQPPRSHVTWTPRRPYPPPPHFRHRRRPLRRTRRALPSRPSC